MPSSRDSCSLTRLLGLGFTLNVFSRTASCSGVARVRLRGVLVESTLDSLSLGITLCGGGGGGGRGNDGVAEYC